MSYMTGPCGSPVSQTLPAELVPAGSTCHVKTACALFDRDVAVGAGLGLFGQPVFCFFVAVFSSQVVFVAGEVLMPWTVVFKTHDKTTNATEDSVSIWGIRVQVVVDLAIGASPAKTSPKIDLHCQTSVEAKLIVQGKGVWVG
jgi:hypothetical protein